MATKREDHKYDTVEFTEYVKSGELEKRGNIHRHGNKSIEGDLK